MTAKQFLFLATLMLSALAPAFLCSCGDAGRARRVLAQADSLMETRPDSALALLRRDSAAINRCGKAERVWYALTRTEVEDKLYIPHYSDSALRRAVKYYAAGGTPLQQVRSRYVLGRVYHDMRLYGSALSSFDDAVKTESGDDLTAYRYKALACEWIGGIYEDRGLFKRSLIYYKRAYGYAKQSDKASLVVYALRDMGRSFRDLHDIQKAITYYKYASEKAKQLKDDKLYNMVMEELAGGIYCKEKMFKEARQALSAPFGKVKSKRDLSSHYFAWGYFYDGIGKTDSAIICFKHGLKYGNKEDNSEISSDLARIYGKSGDLENAIKYYELSLNYADTLRLEKGVENEDLINQVEENIKNERKNMELAEAKIHLVILIFFLIILFAIVVTFFTIWYRRKKRIYAEQRRYALEQWQKTHASDLENILKHEEEIERLKKNLSTSKGKNEDLEIRLNDLERKLSEQNSQMRSELNEIETLISEFKRTDIYQKFHVKGFVPSMQDFSDLENMLNKVYNRFTFHLKEMYPGIQIDEIQICCLIKIGLKLKDICNIMAVQPNVLSMKRMRLYQKFFNKKGSASEFDTFIRGL